MPKKPALVLRFGWVTALLLVSCSIQRYILISEHGLKKEVEKRRKVPRARYVTVPFYYEEYIQKRPLPEPDTLVYRFASMIINQEYKAIEQLIEKVNRKIDAARQQPPEGVTMPDTRSKEVLHFSQGLYHFFKGEYARALEFFDAINDPRYKCMALLLKADCTYEIGQEAGTDIVKIYPGYKKALDCTQDETQQQVIRIRMMLVQNRK